VTRKADLAKRRQYPTSRRSTPHTTDPRHTPQQPRARGERGPVKTAQARVASSAACPRTGAVPQRRPLEAQVIAPARTFARATGHALSSREDCLSTVRGHAAELATAPSHAIQSRAPPPLRATPPRRRDRPHPGAL